MSAFWFCFGPGDFLAPQNVGRLVVFAPGSRRCEGSEGSERRLLGWGEMFGG